MRNSHWVVSLVVVLFGTAGCGGGGGGGTTPNNVAFMAGGVDLITSTYSASIMVTDSSSNGAAIPDAVVTVNGAALTYYPASKWYAAGVVVPDASGNFNFSVTAKGVTYTAVESKLDSVPVISMPATFVAASANSVSWTVPSGASKDMIYDLSITLDDGSYKEVYATGWIQSASVNIPSNATVAGTKYRVFLTAAKPGASIANAASGSNFSVNAYAQPLAFTAQ